MIDEKQYNEWLGYIFENRAISANLDERYYQTDPDDLVELIRLTCVHCSTDLKRYSNAQLNHGLYQLFIDFVFSFKDCDLYYEDIVIALHSIWYLYLDLFNERCDPVLSHLDEPTNNELNSICYMLWDITPLAYWPDNPNSKQYYSAIAGVMEQALYLSNPACIESALHGLGHTHHENKEQVIHIIDCFLKKTKDLCPELITYANHAKIGYIQ